MSGLVCLRERLLACAAVTGQPRAAQLRAAQLRAAQLRADRVSRDRRVMR